MEEKERWVLKGGGREVGVEGRRKRGGREVGVEQRRKRGGC